MSAPRGFATVAGRGAARGGARSARLAARGAVLCAVLLIAPHPAAAWTVEEHRLLGDRVMSVVASEIGDADRVGLRRIPVRGVRGASGARSDSVSFGTLCAWAADDDRARARYHLKNRTLLQELQGTPVERVDSECRLAQREDRDLLDGGAKSFHAHVRQSDAGNVVASYWIHHAAALRLATEGLNHDALRHALIEEAIAQGYLADAFSAGHLMPPPALGLGDIYHTNRGHVHDYYSHQGVYVLNARGDAWQTFGDRLLLWYGPSFTHVFEACVTSLREVILVSCVARVESLRGALAAWADSLTRATHMSQQDLAASWVVRRDAAGYFTERPLPTLMLIPTPAVATWSVRTDRLDEHGIHARHHYPQLAEQGGHDPTLDRGDISRLPSRAAVPGWMIPDTLFKSDPLSLVRDHPDFASARFVQPREMPPSYAGLLLSVGETRYDDASGGGGHHTYGVGFSPAGESAMLLHRISLDALLLDPIDDAGPRAVAFMIGFDPRLLSIGVAREPWLRWINNVRLSGGPAWSVDEQPRPHGARYTLGLESPVVPLRFTNAALTLRLEAEWLHLERPRRGLALTLVMQ
jgi:hypothetical protein